MIIFDLDGTLADCEHRRHFVDAHHPVNEKRRIDETSIESSPEPELEGYSWKPDWKAFYEACKDDDPIYSTIGVFKMLVHCWAPIEIWSGRCESVRERTIKWLSYYISPTITWGNGRWDQVLKMRPIGDFTPDDELNHKIFECRWNPLNVPLLKTMCLI